MSSHFLKKKTTAVYSDLLKLTRFLTLELLLWIFLFFLPFVIHAQTQEFFFDWSASTLHDSLSQNHWDPIVVTALSYECDTALAQKEFLELVGWTGQRVFDDDALARALARFFHKKKYKSIKLVLTQEGSLHWIIASHWVVSQVKCSGSFLYQDQYKHLYLLEPGERFDQHKHAESLKNIKNHLSDEGYVHASVQDSLEYDVARKAIRIALHIERGVRSCIDDIIIRFFPDSGRPDAQLRRLAAALKSEEILKKFIGSVYKEETCARLREALLDGCAFHGFFQATVVLDPVIEDNHVTLTCSIDLQTKRTFEFFGNNAFTKAELLESIMTFGKALVYVPASFLADELTAWYKKHGFFDVVIAWREEEERCFFCVTEGQPITLKKVSVQDMHYFDTHKFAQLFGSLLQKKKFNKKHVLAVIHAVQQQYVRAGFWDCIVEEESYRPLGENVYELILKVVEGRQRLLKSIHLMGLELAPEQSFFDFYEHLKKPIPFDRELLHEQRRFLLRRLQDRGYLQANPKPQLDEEPDGITVLWHSGIDENTSKTVFGTTIITGFTRLPHLHLTRELTYDQGTVWHHKKIIKSLEKLRSLGIFEKVSLVAAPEISHVPTQEKDLLLTVVDDDPFELRVRGGMQSIGRNYNFQELSYRAGGSFFWKNPLNHADRLSFDGDITKYTRNFVGGYQFPWLAGYPLAFDCKGYSIRFDEPVSTYVSERLYRLAQDGAATSFMFKQDDVQAGVGCGVEWMEVSKLSDRHARAINFAPRLVDQKIPYFFIEPTYMISRLDDPVTPRLGFITLLTGKAMVSPKITHSNFCKIQAEQSLFAPLWTAVFAFRIRFGHIFNDCFARIMPSERFYLGGAYSLRSYETDLVPPFSCAEFCTVPALVPQGGKTMFNATAELRVPLYSYLGAVLFSDCGALAQDDLTAYSDFLVGSFGFGVRLYTPVGPIRFDIGWKWRLTEFERHRYAWCLTLGEMF